MNTRDESSVRTSIMEAISAGRVHMKPRWHFILFSAFGILGIAIVVLTLLYITSLAVFFLRESGALFVPSFGSRGWLTLMHSLPWLLIAVIVVFVVVLQQLVRRYRFVYGKPLLVSLAAIVGLVAVGGFAIGETSFHHDRLFDARHGRLPLGMDMLYGPAVRPERGSEVYHGEISEFIPGGFILVDIEHEGTTTVMLTQNTRLPYGEDFEVGDYVVVMGDVSATGTVRAFGIREVQE